MIFGWGKKNDDGDDDDGEDEEVDLVLFQGALNGKDANLAANARLADAGLIPAKEIVTDGIDRRAGTVRVDPKGERYGVTYIIDGMPYPGDRLNKQEGLAVVQMLKLLSGLDIKERKATQNGGMKAEHKGEPYLIDVQSSLGEGGLEKLQVRCRHAKKDKLDSAADIGMPEPLKQKIRENAGHKGLFCAVGPPGSGVSTLFYASVRALDCYTRQIFTIGDHGGRNLDNITAFEENEGDDLTTTIQRVLRVDADTIILPTLRDAETVAAVMKYREDCAFLAEFPARDSIQGMLQLLKWVGDPQMASQSLNGVVTRKLVRTLCSKCKQAYRPNAQFLKKAGLPASASVLYRKPKPTGEEGEEEEPCRKCDDIGYYGQVSMFEYLEMTEGMRALIATNPDASAIRAKMREEKMPTLDQDGLRLVAEGKTSLEELQRVFKSP